MMLYFTLWNVFIQDGNFEELHIDDIFSCNLSLYNLKNSLHVKKQTTKVTRIKNNEYTVVGFIYRIKNSVIFLEANGINFTIDHISGSNIYDDIKVNQYYQFKALMDYDIWNNYGLEKSILQYDNEVSVSGVIKSLKIDTSKYIQVSQKEFTKVGVEPIYDVCIKETSCWDDERNFANGSFYYLVEIEVDEVLNCC